MNRISSFNQFLDQTRRKTSNDLLESRKEITTKILQVTPKELAEEVKYALEDSFRFSPSVGPNVESFIPPNFMVLVEPEDFHLGEEAVREIQSLIPSEVQVLNDLEGFYPDFYPDLIEEDKRVFVIGPDFYSKLNKEGVFNPYSNRHIPSLTMNCLPSSSGSYSRQMPDSSLIVSIIPDASKTYQESIQISLDRGLGVGDYPIQGYHKKVRAFALIPEKSS